MPIITCHECHTQYDNAYANCPSCGNPTPIQPVPTVQCPNCGASVPQGAQCQFCGSLLPQQPPQNFQTQQAYQQPQQGYPQQAYNGQYAQQGYYQQPYAPISKSKVTAGILALLLGGLGIHYFYLGKPLPGIVYLLLCWTFIPALLALVQGIVFLTMREDEFQAKFVNTRNSFPFL